MLTRLILAAAIALSGLPAATFAQTAEQTEALYEALELPAMLEIMRTEGISYGEQVGSDLFPDRAGPEWAAMVEQVYDPEAMTAQVGTALSDALEGDDVAAMLAFFTSEPGRTLVSLEVSARRALLDDAIEEASKEAAAIALADDTPRIDLIREFVDVNDLIETNVVGAMNANFAFYLGLMQGGAFSADLTEEEILTDVWSQEADIRANTAEWVYSYLLLAYQPASDADLEAYIAFSKTEAGRDLNNAMFTAFDGMFEAISGGLGYQASLYMSGQDL